MKVRMKIGVLALQGAVAEHIRSLNEAGADAVTIKRPEELHGIDGLVIPGGESTTIGKLMRTYGFIEAIKVFSKSGKPIFGTCAGMIVLAKRINGSVGPEDPHLGLMDMTVRRNAYGRQRESFETDLNMNGIEAPVRAVFIRAPLIESVGEAVVVLSTYKDEIVAVRQDHLLACSFHPELTDDYSLHTYFVRMVSEQTAAT